MNLNSVQNYYAQKKGYLDWKTMAKRSNIYEMEVHWRKLTSLVQSKLQERIAKSLIDNFSDSYTHSINKITKDKNLIIR